MEAQPQHSHSTAKVTIDFIRDLEPDFAATIIPLLEDEHTQKALSKLREDFTEPRTLGQRRATEFMTGGRDSNLEADVAGLVRKSLETL